MILSLSVHEWAHAWVAYRLGDPTAKERGRLTLNPIKHVDMMGTIILPTMLILSGGLFFGWAKPVPVDGRRFHPGVHPKTGMLLTAAAGPLSNLAIALFMGILLGMRNQLGLNQEAMIQFMGIMLELNVILAVFNLLPIPPLDGGRVLAGILPTPWAIKMRELESKPFYAPIAFFVVIVFGGLLIGLPVTWLLEAILWLTQGLGVIVGIQ